MAPKRRKGADDAGTPSPKKRRKNKKGESTDEPAPLTPQQILNAAEINPPDCYIIGPPNNKWVDNAKAIGSYLGFKTVAELREWLKEDNPESESGIQVPAILKIFQNEFESNYGKPSKAMGGNRTNVP